MTMHFKTLMIIAMWVFMAFSSVSIYAATPLVTLDEGWNLKALGSDKSATVDEITADQPCIVSIWKWVSGNWEVYLPGESDGGSFYAASKGFGQLTIINHDEGFWANCVDALAGQCSAPASITIPASDLDGNYLVSWPASVTVGVSYTLQEATEPTFVADLRTAYSGSNLSAAITGRSADKTYYYRIKATKDGIEESPWINGGNGCAQNITGFYSFKHTIIKYSNGITLTEANFPISGTMVLGTNTISQSFSFNNIPQSMAGSYALSYTVGTRNGIMHVTDMSGNHDIQFSINDNELTTYAYVPVVTTYLPYEEWDTWTKTANNAVAKVSSAENEPYGKYIFIGDLLQ